MKKKNSLYFLLPAVILIWVIIGLKVFNYIKNSQPLYVPVSQIKNSDGVNKRGNEKYDLLLNYRDPFQGKITKKKTKVQSVSAPVISQRQPVIVNSKEEKSINTRNINYFGFIESQGSERRALLSFNRREFIVKKGDVVDEYIIGDIFSDSLKIILGKQFVYVHRAH